MEKITKHSSVGAIIKQDEKILMLDRLSIPLGWACPAGHIEAGERPEQVLIRETKEETNIEVKKYKLLIHEFVPFGTCRRGFTGHYWFVYEILDRQGNAELMEKNKHRAVAWKTISEIKQLQTENKLEEVWEYFFKKLKIIF